MDEELTWEDLEDLAYQLNLYYEEERMKEYEEELIKEEESKKNESNKM